MYKIKLYYLPGNWVFITPGTFAYELDGRDCSSHLCFCLTGSHGSFCLGLWGDNDDDDMRAIAKASSGECVWCIWGTAGWLVLHQRGNAEEGAPDHPGSGSHSGLDHPGRWQVTYAVGSSPATTDSLPYGTCHFCSQTHWAHGASHLATPKVRGSRLTILSCFWLMSNLEIFGKQDSQQLQ